MSADTKNCRAAAGKFRPSIDRNRCEGKADCVAVCPYDVFEIGVLPPQERSGLSWRGKLKGFGHGWKQAFLKNEGACRACALCVEACPEQAIKLVRST